MRINGAHKNAYKKVTKKVMQNVNLKNMDYRRYDTYKDSSIEWLGEIPTHWEVKRLKNCLSEPPQYGANEESTETNPEWVRYVRITDISEDGRLREETFASLPPEIAEQYILRDGDLLLARSGATVGKAFKYQESWGKCCFAGYLIRFHPNQLILSSDFLGYFVRTNAYESWIDSSFIQATIQNVNAQKYVTLRIPVPTILEQTAIADFLDEQTAQIDRLIENNENQIERLKEYRKIVIQNAITGKWKVYTLCLPVLTKRPLRITSAINWR